MITLVTLIGRSRSLVNPASHGYARMKYRFTSGTVRESNLFGLALLDELRESRGIPIDRVVIVGTPTSTWAELAECLMNRSGPEQARAAEAWWIRAADLYESGQPVPQPLLDEAAALLTASLGIEAITSAIPEDAGGMEEVALLRRVIPPKEQVYLDITHGFRTTPLHLVLGLQALEWTRDVRLAGVHYGKVIKDSTGIEVALDGVNRILRAMHPLAFLHLRDDLSELSNFVGDSGDAYLRTACDQVAEAHRLEELLLLPPAARARSQALGQLRKVEWGDPLSEECGVVLFDALSAIPRQNNAEGLIQRSIGARSRRDWLRAVVFAIEALRAAAIRACPKLEAEAWQRHGKNNPGRLGEFISKGADDIVLESCTLPGVPVPLVAGVMRSKSAFEQLRRLRNLSVHLTTGAEQTIAERSEERYGGLIDWAVAMVDFLGKQSNLPMPTQH
ncbi:MAG: CRISPR-associated DxTHG motif protein [Planctomycetota bacterium]|nr:CRISPR-associated DxTHG motif protein [Planctomycetota bacterium]